MKNLVQSVLKVMDECKGIDKNLTVGSGGNSYKGVGDKDVKLKVGESMRKHGLIILPTGVKPNTTINHYEDQYGKQKMSVFTEVITEYLLIHESGEQVNLVGFGHGTDTQDKSAGKATTYALKYTLLYSFLVATGHIDDTDNTHSDDLPTPPKQQPKPQPQQPDASSSLAYGGQLEGKYSEMLLGMEKQGLLTPEEITKMTAKVDWNENTYRIAYNWAHKASATRLAARSAAESEKSQAVGNMRSNKP